MIEEQESTKAKNITELKKSVSLKKKEKASIEKNKSVAPFVYGGLGLLIVAAIVLYFYYRTKKNEAE